LTTNTLVSPGDLGLPGFQSVPLWYGTDGSSTEPYAWDSTHTYQMQLWAQGGADGTHEEANLTTDMFAVPEFTSTARLLTCGLTAMALWRRRWR
jgi:hypothetical protein